MSQKASSAARGLLQFGQTNRNAAGFAAFVFSLTRMEVLLSPAAIKQNPSGQAHCGGLSPRHQWTALKLPVSR
jgi:hypothetical protein